jgi:hypothetical protein
MAALRSNNVLFKDIAYKIDCPWQPNLWPPKPLIVSIMELQEKYGLYVFILRQVDPLLDNGSVNTFPRGQILDK